MENNKRLKVCVHKCGRHLAAHGQDFAIGSGTLLLDGHVIAACALGLILLAIFAYQAIALMIAE